MAGGGGSLVACRSAAAQGQLGGGRGGDGGPIDQLSPLRHCCGPTPAICAKTAQSYHTLNTRQIQCRQYQSLDNIHQILDTRRYKAVSRDYANRIFNHDSTSDVYLAHSHLSLYLPLHHTTTLTLTMELEVVVFTALSFIITFSLFIFLCAFFCSLNR